MPETGHTAIFSDCGRYRYRLTRDLRPLWGGPQRVMTVIMVNPSTADEVSDDRTIVKVRGAIVGNLFAWRSTDIRGLRLAADPIGPENDVHLSEMIAAADLLLVAWGSLDKLPEHLRDRWRAVPKLAAQHGVTMRCLGTVKDGHPRHPLMPGYATPLEVWEPPG